MIPLLRSGSFQRHGVERGPFSWEKLFLLGSFFLSLFFMANPVPCAWAINANVSNVELVDADTTEDTVEIEFDLDWAAAWIDGVNHDAVWMFFKYSVDSGWSWRHVLLNASGVNPSGFSTGTGTQYIDMRVPEDKVGVFIATKKMSGQQYISHSYDNLKVVWDYGANGVTDLQIIDSSTTKVRAYAIEMVYVPEGDFEVGDGNAADESSYAFHVSDDIAVQITKDLTTGITVDSNSNDEIDTAPIGVDGDGGLDDNNDGVIDNKDYPTGYKAFYMMKSEISQAQYVDFLNTLTTWSSIFTRIDDGQAFAADAMSSNNYYTAMYSSLADMSPVSRNSIFIKEMYGCGDYYGYSDDPSIARFGNDLTDDMSCTTCGDNSYSLCCSNMDGASDGEWVAMNLMTWMDLAAFADWAGLRPMTELEFEKAARGSEAAVLDEFAWGTASVTQKTNITNSGQATEYSNTSVSGNNGPGVYDNAAVEGPFRSGGAAGMAATRIPTGSSYYGALDLSGNVAEQVVSLGDSAGHAFRGTHGDGVLYQGSHGDNKDWPGYSTSYNYVYNAAGAGLRGGAWDDADAEPLRVSDRTNAALGQTTRDDSAGGRLVRTSPEYEFEHEF